MASVVVVILKCLSQHSGTLATVCSEGSWVSKAFSFHNEAARTQHLRGACPAPSRQSFCAKKCVQKTLLLLEALRLELQRAAVLGHGADHLIGSAVRKVGRDLKRDCDVGVGRACQMAVRKS